jgi:hypothetical protein
MSGTRMTALCGAVALMLHPVAAAAQETCVTEEEVGALLIFLAPSLIEAVQERCAGHIAADGFLALEGADLASTYRPLGEAAWPSAKSVLFKIAGQRRKAREVETMAKLPDETLQPLFAGMMAQELTKELEAGKCRRVERLLEALAPIEPHALGSLVGVVTGLAGTRRPSICPAD